MKITKITNIIDYIQPDDTPFASTSSGIFIRSTPSIAIDMNLGEEDVEKFLAENSPDIAIISHYHLDHSLWGHAAENNNGTELWIPEDEVKYFTSLDYFIENTCGPYDISLQFKNVVQKFMKYKEVSSFKTFNDGTVFKCKGLSLRSIKSPGHSPAHTAFHIPEENILFTGDIGVGQWGPWYGWIDCSILHYMESIFRLKAIGDVRLVTCHDGIISEDIPSVWDSCMDKFYEREILVMDMLNRGCSKDEIVAEGIYFKKKSKIAEPMKSLLNVQDEIMLEHHLNIINDGGLAKMFPDYKYSNK